ncbi:MAG TPA: hypothetical protein VIM73_13125 [Polyangiaceae bacterium]
MGDAASNASSETVSAKLTTFSRSARAWSAVAVAFVAVVGVAMWLFSRYSQARSFDLNDQFSRAAARIGKQVELRYDNYHQLFDNVARILASAESMAGDVHRDQLSNAQTLLRDAEQQTILAKKRVDSARALQERTQAALERARGARTQVEQVVRDRVQKADAAAALAQTLEEQAQKAEAEQVARARTLDQAEAKLREAASKLAALQEAPPPSAVPTTGKSSSVSEPPADPESDGVQQAQRELVSAQAAVSAAQASLSVVTVTATQKRREAVEASSRADAAWAEVEPVLNSALETRVAQDKAAASAARAQTDARAALQGAEATREAEQRAAAAASAASAVDGPEAARLFRSRLLNVVLPSYRPAIEACSGEATLAATTLCAARAIAELSAHGARGLTVSSCGVFDHTSKASGKTAAVSRDGVELLLRQGGDSPNSVCGRVPVSRLLAPPKGALGGFDAIALLRHDGVVLHAAETASNLRIVRLPEVDAKRMKASAVVPNIELAGDKYRVFLQPVNVVVESAGATHGLVIAGFISEARLAKATVEISLSSYLWVLLLLGVGILSLPLAKLWLLGPSASFTRFDVTLLATAAVVTAALSCLLLLSFVAHNGLSKRAESQTRRVAEELQLSLYEKLTSSASVLREFLSNEHVSKLSARVTSSARIVDTKALSDRCKLTPHSAPLENALFDGSVDRWTVCETRGLPLQPSQPWNLAFLTNSLGYQLAKFVPAGSSSAPISVEHRSYFREALAGKTGCLDAKCTNHGVAEVVRSATSGELVLVLAAPAGKETVAAVEAPLRGLEKIILPLGFQAAVIDRDGRVMLHSDNDAAHGQVLSADMDAPTEFRAALANQGPDSIVLRYLGAPSRVYLQPVGLPGLGWTVVVLAPLNIVDVATTDMVLTTLFGFGALIGALILLVCLGVLLKRLLWLGGMPLSPRPDESRSVQLRPSGKYSEEYAEAGVWMLRTALILCAVALLSQGRWFTVQLLMNAGLAWIALCKIPGVRVRLPEWCKRALSGIRRSRLALMLSAVFEERARSVTEGRHWRSSLPFTYAVCCLGISGLFVITPVTILFSGAYDHVMESLVRAELHDLAARAGRNPDCLAPGPGRVAASGSTASGATQPTRCRSVFAGEPLREVGKMAPDRYVQCAITPLPCLSDYLPPLGCDEIQSLGRLYRSGLEPQGTGPSAREYEFRRLGSELQLISTTRGVALSSVTLPTLERSSFHIGNLVVLLLVFAGFCAGASAVAFYSLRRLFFLEQVHPPYSDAPDFGKSALVLFADDSLEGRLRQRGFVDLPSEPHTAPPGRWLVPNLETMLTDPAQAAWLEAAKNTPSTIVLLSAAEPMRRVTEASRSAWANALSGFPAYSLQRPVTPALGASVAEMTRTWLECDDHERHVLVQLAVEGYANPHANNKESLEHLVRRGILCPNTLTIANPAFPAVVRDSVRAEEQRRWQDADQGSAWHALRVPLSTAVVALFGAVTVSKPELGAASALVPTLAAGFPTILKLLLEMTAGQKGNG